MFTVLSGESGIRHAVIAIELHQIWYIDSRLAIDLRLGLFVTSSDSEEWLTLTSVIDTLCWSLYRRQLWSRDSSEWPVG